MKSIVLGFLAETCLHPGTEQSTGVVDLPVAREAATGYPVIVGSSVKGALRDAARQRDMDKRVRSNVFGDENAAGGVAVTDARLLLLPVRSLTGHFKLVTCPYILERYQRDMALAGKEVSFTIPKPNEECALTSVKETNLFLEEMSFKVQKEDLSDVADAINILIKHQDMKKRLPEQIALLTNKEFSYFTNYALQVNARNVLDKETKKSKNLWYEETLPTDSLFYSLLLPGLGKEDLLNEIKGLFSGIPYLQMGGNETVGQGWCSVHIVEEVGANG